MNTRIKPTHLLSSRLPYMLGFGRLDKQSINHRSKELYAEYRSGEDLVYTARLTRQSCRLEEFFAGKSLGVSEQPSLENAFFYLPTLYSPKEHPRLAEAFAELLRSRLNIQLDLPLRVNYLYFPAGLIFYLQLPITKSNRSAWEELRTRAVRDPQTSLLKTLDLHKVSLHPAPYEGKPDADETKIAELTALMIDLRPICQLLSDSGVLSTQANHPLRITLSSARRSSNKNRI